MDAPEPAGRHVRSHVIRATMVAAVVGTILISINHPRAMIGREWTPDLWWKVPLTYCVPFLVSLYSSLRASR